jgi:hypothetical protein
MLSLNKLCVGMVFSCITLPALAGDISMRGFASIVGGQSLQSEEGLYGYEGNFGFRSESLAALQFKGNLDDGLSATVQLVARGRDDFAANVEWAYLTYEFSDSVQLSAGRIRVPFYRYSDFIDVRYTYPWINVPQTVYGFNLPGYDGLSLVVKNELGGWDSTLQVIFGQVEGDLANSDLRIRSENMTGFSWSVTRDWLSLRVGYMTSKTSLAIAQYAGIQQLVQGIGLGTGVDTSELADGVVLEDDKGDFLGLAVGIDYNDWLMNAEYITYSIDNSMLAESDAYYVMFGKRINQFTPYITYSNASGEPSKDVLDLVPAALTNIPIPQIGNATLPQFLNGVIAASEEDTDLLMAGLRYDFHAGAALKTEYLMQEDISGERIEIVRVGVDVVF